MGWKEVAENLKTLRKVGTSVGWHSSAVYPEGTPVALVAITHEYGSEKKKIPARPTVRPAQAEHSKEWSRQMKLGMQAVIRGKISADDMILGIGTMAATQIQRNIAELTTPELSELTIAIRTKMGYQPDKPLVRSKLMYSTCTAELVK